MNTKAVLVLVLLAAIFIAGCAKSQYSSQYASAYGQVPAAQGQAIQGGGCGVAPQGDYGETPVESLTGRDTSL